MSAVINLIGKTFGQLRVTERAANDKRGRARWVCICACGNNAVAVGYLLRTSAAKSCGCMRATILATHAIKHRLSDTPEHYIWRGMKQRCYNPNNKSFKNYGGRGITICDRWQNSFENFLADMGKKPSPTHSIDRVNNDGNYEPANCRWATNQEQSDNKRTRAARPFLRAA